VPTIRGRGWAARGPTVGCPMASAAGKALEPRTIRAVAEGRPPARGERGVYLRLGRYVHLNQASAWMDETA